MKHSMTVLLLISFGVLAFAQDADAQRRRSGQRRGNQADSLTVGEMAPTFALKSLDGDSETDLASFQGEKPVVLFFGSYT